ncbi:MAG: hypothetical protein Q9186_004950 [Xanthomendoza sp. 1 TL-2023]
MDHQRLPKQETIVRGDDGAVYGLVSGNEVTSYMTEVRAHAQAYRIMPLGQRLVGVSDVKHRAITLCTNGTVFAPSTPDAGIDTLGLGTISPLISTEAPDKTIHLGNFKPHAARTSNQKSPNLKEREHLHLLTIPANGEVQVKHNLPVSRMLKYDNHLGRKDLYPGESYRFRLNPDYVGTTWWCWGDLEGDLVDKKLSAWQEGLNPEKVEKPTPAQVDEENWVLGGNPAELAFEEKTGEVGFQFVE